MDTSKCDVIHQLADIVTDINDGQQSLRKENRL